jgi:DNA modification methylase
MEIKFKKDTSFRKTLFTSESFSHPAKMDSQLLIWCVERYSKPGDTILDPMFGSGTTMLACPLGRNVVGVELESKFVRMSLNNWGKVQTIPQLGLTMGNCLILWGDSRDIRTAKLHPYRELWKRYPSLDVTSVKSVRRKNGLKLENMPNLVQLSVNGIFTSPPYMNRMDGGNPGLYERDNILVPYSGDPSAWFTQRPQNNIGNLRYGQIDGVVTSPPFAGSKEIQDPEFLKQAAEDQSRDPKGHGYSKEAREKMWDKRQSGLNESPDDVGALPYGQVDQVITSTPYGDSLSRDRSQDDKFKGDRTHHGGSLPIVKGYQGTNKNIGRLPYGDADAVFTSPPYMQAQTGGGIAQEGYCNKRGIYQEYQSDKIGGGNMDPVGKRTYMPENAGRDSRNIQLLKYTGAKSENYLQAMLLVYRQCFMVLKPTGVMVLVTKNFVKEKQVVRLDLDTIKLAETAGFTFLERHYRKLPGQSFWRNNYKKKYPEVDVSSLDFEDVLVFKK